MELEHGVQELQRCHLDNPCTHCREIPQSSLPDYIIDRFMHSLQVQESPRHSRFPLARSHAKSTPDATEDLLKKVCVKLEKVARDRYVMQQMAKIEMCRCGIDLQELEHIEWDQYSGCPKNTLKLDVVI